MRRMKRKFNYHDQLKKPGIYAARFDKDDYSYELLPNVDRVIVVLPTKEKFDVAAEDLNLTVRTLDSTLVALPRAGNALDIHTESAYAPNQAQIINNYLRVNNFKLVKLVKRTRKSKNKKEK